MGLEELKNEFFHRIKDYVEVSVYSDKDFEKITDEYIRYLK